VGKKVFFTLTAFFEQFPNILELIHKAKCVTDSFTASDAKGREY